MVKTEDRLSDVLSEFARTLLTDFPIQGILDRLVGRIAEILPVDAAGVSLISPTMYPRFIAGSDESATRYEHLQTALQEGPCLAAYQTEEPISIPNLQEDARFPHFAERAHTEGLVAVFTFPLRNAGRCLGALDLYRTTAGGLDAQDMIVAQTLADVATAYLLNAQSRQAQMDLVATVSHELRTPMMSIIGYIELIRHGDAGPLTNDQVGFLDAVQRNSDRLLALANHLSTLSGLELRSIRPELELVDVGQVISTVRSTLEPVISRRELEVTFEVPDAPLVVRGREDDLGSVVSNLLTNAMKFTDDGGWVRCTLRSVRGQARLEVSDNGLGIPEEEQGYLFSRFFRSSTANELSIQGSGLGLNIAASIVKSYGGDISVMSEHLGGSTFAVNLPLIDATIVRQPDRRVGPERR